MRGDVRFRSGAIRGVVVLLLVILLGLATQKVRSQSMSKEADRDAAAENAVQLAAQGRHIFRFDTFGDQAFWGDTLKLHEAIEGSKLGGVGPGVSPKLALEVGLKIDRKALPGHLLWRLQHGLVNLNDHS
jgi:hypothetical protein